MPFYCAQELLLEINCFKGCCCSLMSFCLSQATRSTMFCYSFYMLLIILLCRLMSVACLCHRLTLALWLATCCCAFNACEDAILPSLRSFAAFSRCILLWPNHCASFLLTADGECHAAWVRVICSHNSENLKIGSCLLCLAIPCYNWLLAGALWRLTYIFAWLPWSSCCLHLSYYPVVCKYPWFLALACSAQIGW